MHFRLLLLGENFPMEVECDRASMGWFKTVWVEAANEDEAKAKSLEIIRAEPSLASIPSGCGAKVSWDEIEEVEIGELPETPAGLTFFRMEH